MDHHAHHMPMEDTTTTTTTAAITTTINHALHNITTAMSMDHAGHHMATTMGMDHAGHNMATTMGMNHGDHHMGTTMDHGSMDHGSMPGMKMYFHDGYEEYVLFKECLTQSAGAMVGACFIVFFLAILYEGLKFLRETLLQRSINAQRMRTYDMGKSNGSSSQESLGTEIRNPPVLSRIFSGSHCLQTALHMVQVFISYCLMLVFMTYNVWLCLAIIVGAGVGYFVFGWKRAVVVDSNEHCH